VASTLSSLGGSTASEPVQPEDTQGILDESWEESVNMGREASTEVEEHDPTPATPVESAHTTPSSEPRRRREDEDDFDESPDPFLYRDDERLRQRSFSEDEAEAVVLKTVRHDFVLSR
jgi:hypothetical protein